MCMVFSFLIGVYAGCTCLCMSLRVETRGQPWMLAGSLIDVKIAKEARVGGQ